MSIQPTFPEKFPSDPKESGPGLWFILHTAAKEAKTEEKKKCFRELLDIIKRNHPCQNCRVHTEEFIKGHPLENFWEIKSEKGDEIGLFLWTFIFHNSVNSRLNKKQLDWETSYNMYSDESISPCTSECGETKVVNKPKFIRRERDYYH